MLPCSVLGLRVMEPKPLVRFTVVPGTNYILRVVTLAGYIRGHVQCSCARITRFSATTSDGANAPVIGDGTFPFDNTAATGTDISSCTTGDNLDVWYEYLATCTGTATVSTCGNAAFDTGLSAWDACGGTEIACNDDACASVQSEITFPCTSGTSYWIRIAGFNGAIGTGNIVVSCQAPINGSDDCASADPIGNGTYVFDCTSATGTD